MATFTAAAPRLTRVAVAPATPAAQAYADARIAGFAAQPSLNLRNHGGRTLEHLAYRNVYVGAWDVADTAALDAGLAAAMRDDGQRALIARVASVPVPSGSR